MGYSSCECLEVWRRACDLAVTICRESAGVRQFALRTQIQRSAISVPSNIAEGSERDSAADFIRFLRIAKGSIAELRTQILIARRLDQWGQDQFILADREAREIGSMIQGLIKYLTNGPATMKEAGPEDATRPPDSEKIFKTQY